MSPMSMMYYILKALPIRQKNCYQFNFSYIKMIYGKQSNFLVSSIIYVMNSHKMLNHSILRFWHLQIVFCFVCFILIPDCKSSYNQAQVTGLVYALLFCSVFCLFLRQDRISVLRLISKLWSFCLNITSNWITMILHF